MTTLENIAPATKVCFRSPKNQVFPRFFGKFQCSHCQEKAKVLVLPAYARCIKSQGSYEGTQGSYATMVFQGSYKVTQPKLEEQVQKATRSSQHRRRTSQTPPKARPSPAKTAPPNKSNAAFGTLKEQAKTTPALQRLCWDALPLAPRGRRIYCVLVLLAKCLTSQGSRADWPWPHSSTNSAGCAGRDRKISKVYSNVVQGCAGHAGHLVRTFTQVCLPLIRSYEPLRPLHSFCLFTGADSVVTQWTLACFVQIGFVRGGWIENAILNLASRRGASMCKH